MELSGTTWIRMERLLMYALRLGLEELYELVVDAGVRAELLLSRLNEYQLLGDGNDSGMGRTTILRLLKPPRLLKQRMHLQKYRYQEATEPEAVSQDASIQTPHISLPADFHAKPAPRLFGQRCHDGLGNNSHETISRVTSSNSKSTVLTLGMAWG